MGVSISICLAQSKHLLSPEQACTQLTPLLFPPLSPPLSNQERCLRVRHIPCSRSTPLCWGQKTMASWIPNSPLGLRSSHVLKEISGCYWLVPWFLQVHPVIGPFLKVRGCVACSPAFVPAKLPVYLQLYHLPSIWLSPRILVAA